MSKNGCFKYKFSEVIVGLSLAYLPLKLYEKIVIKSWCISGCFFCKNCVKMSVIYSKFHYGIKNKVENLHI